MSTPASPPPYVPVAVRRARVWQVSLDRAIAELRERQARRARGAS
jgi:hypothetical protein